MTRRRVLWLVVAAASVLAVVAVLIPGSPIHVANWFAPLAQHEGRSTRSWMKELNNPDAEVRRQAIFSIGAIGPDAGDAVPALAAILRDDDDPAIRSEAALALSKMAPASRGAVEALAGALKDELPLVRMNAAIALLRLGEEARPAVPAMIEALADPTNRTNTGRFHATIQEMVAIALGRASAGTTEAVPALTEALKKAHTREVRISMVRALGEVGEAARDTKPLLVPLLDDRDREQCKVTEEALRRMGEDEDQIRKEREKNRKEGPVQKQPRTKFR
jgi:HEAT repeat protein